LILKYNCNQAFLTTPTCDRRPYEHRAIGIRSVQTFRTTARERYRRRQVVAITGYYPSMPFDRPVKLTGLHIACSGNFLNSFKFVIF